MNYEIVEQNLSTLLNKLTCLNAKLARIGAAQITYKQVGHTDKPHPVEATKLVRYINLEVEAPKTKASGWEFLATLVHTDDGNIVRNVPGATVPPEFRDRPTWCAHCRCNRVRRDTYVVRHEDGRVMQVGSDCLQEFLGTSASLLTRASQLLFSIYDVCESATKTNWLGGHNGISTFRIDLDTFLANVAAVVLKHGTYITRKMAQAQGGGLTSAESGYNSMMGKTGDQYAVSDEAKKLAFDARSFVLRRLSPVIMDVDSLGDDDLEANVLGNLKGVNQNLNDFEHNLLSCARAEAIEPRLIGTAGYIIEYFRRAQPSTLKPIAHVADLDRTGLVRIFGMFDSATKTGLKRPAIRLADGSGSAIHLSLAGEKSKNVGCIYVRQESGDKNYYGKITPDGKFLPVSMCPPTVGKQLIDFAADPETIAMNYGKLTGCCSFCGRKLTDDRSTDVGYGPVCATKFGLNWGKRATECDCGQPDGKDQHLERCAIYGKPEAAVA
jgi:Family of unknown function (DUF6011)